MIRGSWDLPIAKRPCIIIDNGSYECRAGWSNESEPYLQFKNQISKPKTMTNRDVDSLHIVGDEFQFFDASKLNKKSMFDKEILTNQGLLEHVLDYCFSHLGINEEI